MYQGIRIQIILIFIVLFGGCANNYYKKVYEQSTKHYLDPSFSTYLNVKIDSNNYDRKYVIPFGEINLSDSNSYKSYKELLVGNVTNDNQIILKPDDLVSCNLYSYIVPDDSTLIEKLKTMPLDSIKGQYFEKDIRLKTEILSINERNAIMYCLISRKLYLYYFNPGENPTLHHENIFLEIQIHRNIDKTIEKIELKLGREI